VPGLARGELGISKFRVVVRNKTVPGRIVLPLDFGEPDFLADILRAEVAQLATKGQPSGKVGLYRDESARARFGFAGRNFNVALIVQKVFLAEPVRFRRSYSGNALVAQALAEAAQALAKAANALLTGESAQNGFKNSLETSPFASLPHFNNHAILDGHTVIEVINEFLIVKARARILGRCPHRFQLCAPARLRAGATHRRPERN
jgi:hypothetical protein